MKNVLTTLANLQETRMIYDEAYDITINFRKRTITACAAKTPLADLEPQLPSDWRFAHPTGLTFSLVELYQKGFTFRIT